MLIAGLFCFAMLGVSAQGHSHEGGPRPDAVAGATAPAEPRPEQQPHEGCMMHGMVPTVDFQSVKICFAPQMRAFIAIDSIECSVHLVKMVGEKLDTVGSYQTDNIYKRHDLKNILRPVSVGAMGKRSQPLRLRHQRHLAARRPGELRQRRGPQPALPRLQAEREDQALRPHRRWPGSRGYCCGVPRPDLHCPHSAG